MGESLLKSQVFSNGISGSKTVARAWKVMKEVVVKELIEPMKMLRKCGMWCIKTVDRAYYVEMLKQLRECVRGKRPEISPNDWVLHHDNATAHKALSFKQFLAQKSITEMENPP
jgi:hypothetical protein